MSPASRAVKRLRQMYGSLCHHMRADEARRANPLGGRAHFTGLEALESRLLLTAVSDLGISNLSFSGSAGSTINAGAHPTAMAFTVANYGPTAMSNNALFAQYFLSKDTVFGNGDDISIGNDGISGVTLSSGYQTTFNLSSTGLS